MLPFANAYSDIFITKDKRSKWMSLNVTCDLNQIIIKPALSTWRINEARRHTPQERNQTICLYFGAFLQDAWHTYYGVITRKQTTEHKKNFFFVARVKLKSLALLTFPWMRTHKSLMYFQRPTFSAYDTVSYPQYTNTPMNLFGGIENMLMRV